MLKILKKNFKQINYQLEISSKNDNSRYKYFHRKKLGTTSKKKKNIAVFFICLCKKFKKKNFRKIKNQVQKIDYKRYF